MDRLSNPIHPSIHSIHHNQRFQKEKRGGGGGRGGREEIDAMGFWHIMLGFWETTPPYTGFTSNHLFNLHAWVSQFTRTHFFIYFLTLENGQYFNLQLLRFASILHFFLVVKALHNSRVNRKRWKISPTIFSFFWHPLWLFCFMAWDSRLLFCCSFFLLPPFEMSNGRPSSRLAQTFSSAIVTITSCLGFGNKWNFLWKLTN